MAKVSIQKIFVLMLWCGRIQAGRGYNGVYWKLGKGNKSPWWGQVETESRDRVFLFSSVLKLKT
jgi:hypothetical protein